MSVEWCHWHLYVYLYAGNQMEQQNTFWAPGWCMGAYKNLKFILQIP